jgi:hypothetical protein
MKEKSRAKKKPVLPGLCYFGVKGSDIVPLTMY